MPAAESETAISAADYRANVLESHLVPATLEAMALAPLSPLSNFSDDILWFPRQWMPGGVWQSASKRSINIAISSSQDRDVQYHKLELRRLLYALWFIPHLGGRGRLRFKPTTFVDHAKLLVKITQWIIENRYKSDSLLCHLTIEDYAKIVRIFSLRDVAPIFKVLHYFGAANILSDVPHAKLSEPSLQEASHKNTEPIARESVKHGPHLPFPDELVAELGSRSLWLIRELGPSLLSCFEQTFDPAGFNLGVVTGEPVVAHRRKLVKEHAWIDSQGNAITELPFAIKLPDGLSRKSIWVKAWPPRSYGSIRALVRHLQVAHYTILGLSVGPRFSEVAAAPNDCISESRSAFLTKSFKLTTTIGGEPRSFPLAGVAVHAIEQQQRLAKIVGGESVEKLFVQNGGSRSNLGSDLHDMNDGLGDFLEAIGISYLLDERRAHTHRFRKTVARLIALAIVDAPIIVMDLFGHRNIEMTIAYILSDPLIRLELKDVAKQVSFAMTKAVLDNLDSAEGRGVEKIRAGMKLASIDSGLERYGVSDIAEVAEILTVTGTPFQIIRPGIICTKQRGQYGACSNSKDVLNPSKCKSRCDHRLELQSAKRDADRAIEYLISLLKAQPAVSDLLRANLEGQLLTQLKRFEELRSSWIARDQVVRELWMSTTNALS